MGKTIKWMDMKWQRIRKWVKGQTERVNNDKSRRKRIAVESMRQRLVHGVLASVLTLYSRVPRFSNQFSLNKALQ